MEFTTTQSENVIKTKKSRLIRISSEDKDASSSSTTTNAQFKVQLPSSGKTMDQIVGYVIKSIEVPNVFNNIPSYANSLTLIKTTGSATKTAIITVNQYTIDTFITALQTAINTAITPDTVAVSINSVNKLNFVFTGDTYAFDWDNSTIRDKIGLTADITAAANTTMQSIVNLIGESMIYVHSKAMNQSGLIEAQGNFSVVSNIPMDKPFGVMCYYFSANDTADFVVYQSARSFRTVDIVLRNSKGEVLDLPLNFHCSICVKIWYE